MTIPICCPQCHRQYAAPGHAAGRTIKCPRCKGLIEVPAVEEPQEIVLEGPRPQREPAPQPAPQAPLVAPPVELVLPVDRPPPPAIPIAVPVAAPVRPAANAAIPVAPVVGIPIGPAPPGAPVIGIPVSPAAQPAPSMLDFLDEAAPPPAPVVLSAPSPAPLAVGKKRRNRSRGRSVQISPGFWIGATLLVLLIGLVIAAMVVENPGRIFAVAGLVLGIPVVLVLLFKVGGAILRGLGETSASDDEGGGVGGWVLIFLIYGVGNVILYYTTGWVIIPIRR